MANVSLRELQLYMLDILKEFDRICKKHNIEYFGAYGTCLGAVRHRGFIPWDDDIDVCMKADDYLKFMKVCKTELSSEYYLQSHFTDAKSYIYWNRIGKKNSTSIDLSMSHIHQPWGICIDIFPIFPYTPDSSLQKQRKKYYKLANILSLKHYHLGTMENAPAKEKLKKSIHALLPDSINCALFRHYFLKLCNPTGMDKNYWTSYDAMPENDYLHGDWFEKLVELDFEDFKIPCPVNYDAYLRTYYKDYMQIPDDKTNHSDNPNVIISLTECYEKYLT